MTVAERLALLEASIPVDPANPRSRRFAWRRAEGRLELFDVKWTREVEGEQEFHGHPANRVPPSVLRTLHERGEISKSEYDRLRRELPGC